MSIQESRAKLIASIWQAIAQSGVDLQSIPSDQQAKLVDAIASSTLVTFNDLIEEVSPPEPAPEPAEVVDENAEQVLWKGRPFLSISEKYIITSERIKITRGLVGRDVENYELIRIQDIDFSQNLSERMMKIGDIHISGQDATSAKIVLRNIADPENVYEILRRAWLSARKRHGLQFREYM